jgi:protein gp37
MAQMIIMPAIAMGLIIGIYEALVVHRDVTIPTHRFGHMAHALILSVVFVFVSMNGTFVYSSIPALAKIPLIGNLIVFRIAIGLIAAIKIHATSLAIKGTVGSTRGMGETWVHSLLIGGLVAGAPYLYPLVSPMLPGWLK